MLKIGLTGGIGAGKSATGRVFSSLGIVTIDADRIAHQITSPNTELFDTILCHFGPDILTENGHLNRKDIRTIIFDNPEERIWLEQQLHPVIRSIMTEQIKLVTGPYVVIIIPLLTESKKIDFIDRILLIDADESLQITRASARDGISKDDVTSIIKTQSSRNEKIAQANDIIINNGNLDDLKQKVMSMHKYYISLSTNNTP